jgi:flagellar basal-body rod protein FlgF
MSYGMYLSAEGAGVQAKRLEVIANNLANLETPGFKRDVPVFQARFAEAIQQGTAYPGDKTDNNIGGGVKFHEVDTDFSRGTLRHTKIDTDFAVNGEGFFRILGPDGENLLTRAGNFEIDVQGRLVTRSGGYPVLDASGGVITIDGSQPWTFGPGGQIVQGGQGTPIGLQVPQSLGDLVKVGNNLFRPLAPTTEVATAERDIRQGYLEQSGVSSTREMMAMIETSRAFEANTQLVQNQDSMVSSLIDRVLSS